MTHKKSLVVIIKTVERCNLNCTYCYFFNNIDDSYKYHPPYISQETISDITSFLIQAIQELRIESLTIGFHGGEPLMQKKKDFDLMCTILYENLSPILKQLDFTLQTNGLLINNQWIELLAKYNVQVGVSLDGPAKYNDKYRVDHFNKGSYTRIVERLNYARSHTLIKKLGNGDIGILAVINPEFDYKEVYKHFVKELKISSIDFLIPDFTHDNPPPLPIENYGNALIDIFQEWIKDDDVKVELRFSVNILGMFMGSNTIIYGIGSHAESQLPIISISSNGELGPTDELRTTDPSKFGQHTVSNISLKDFYQTDFMKIVKKAQDKESLPKECLECCYVNICSGRFSTENNFTNASVYCSFLKKFYRKVIAYMIERGYPYSQIQNILIRATT